MKRLIKKVTAVMLVLAMVMGLSITVTADEGTAPELAITKKLEIADGVTTPAATFNFVFTPNTDTEKFGPVEAKGHIDLAASIEYSATDTDVYDDDQIVKDTGNILASKMTSFPHAGVFAYTVTEAADTYTCATGETMSYSNASYVLKVYVVNTDDGGTKIDSVEVVENKENPGKITSGVPGKVDEEGKDTTETTGTESKGNNFVFVNTFDKKGGVNGDGKSLTITNTAAGAYGNKEAEVQYTLTLDVPALSKNVAMTYKINDGEAVSVTGNTVEFKLKHGDTFVLYDAPAGTTYDVVQDGVKYHVTSAVATENGVAGGTQTGTEGAGLTVEDKLIGENTNSVAFTNTRDENSVTPTGIIINNLPYVIMVLIAVLGICMIMVSKRRRA